MSQPDQPPVLRPPTKVERHHFLFYRRWPDSYVQARLDHSDAVGRWCEGRDYFEVSQALHAALREAE